MKTPRRAAPTRLRRGCRAIFAQKTALLTASGPLWRTIRRRSARASTHRSRTLAGSTAPCLSGRCRAKTCRLDVPRPADGTNADVWNRTTDAARARGAGLGYAQTRLGSGRGRGGRKPQFLLSGLVWVDGGGWTSGQVEVLDTSTGPEFGDLAGSIPYTHWDNGETRSLSSWSGG